MNQSNAHRVSVYGANLKAVIGRFEDFKPRTPEGYLRGYFGGIL